MTNTSSHQSVPTKKGVLRVLHTSDWHLGKRLYHQSRDEEFALFLHWLAGIIDDHAVDILLVAGDIFDTMTPSNRAQELYYQFLGMVANGSCKHVVITAGNHDSPSFLEAPKNILGSLGIHVIGAKTARIQDELLILYDKNKPIAIVLAVPYLRDKDVRTSTQGENNTQKLQNTTDGIAQHYQTLTRLAKTAQQELQASQPKTSATVPIIAMGHLFVAGSQVSSSDDGMRELYVGTLGQVSSGIFDDDLDYVALGHIHAPQMVANLPHIRYSGSPIAMGFGEISKEKQVLLVDFQARQPSVYPIAVPIFQPLARILGDWHAIKQVLEDFINTKQSIWVEIVYTGKTLEPNLAGNIYQLIDGSNVQAINIQNQTLYHHSLGHSYARTDLQQLSVNEVFEQLLNQHELIDSEKTALQNAYQQLLGELDPSTL